MVLLTITFKIVVNFVQIQNGHTVPIANMKVPAVRTGYETVMPYRMNETYCYMAEDDGVVDKITKSKVTVIYKNGKKKSVKLGEWTSKEESHVSYKHTLVTDLKVGDKFKHGNTITYDEAFFEPDIFDKTRVIYKTGNSIKVAMMETTETYEDACTVSKSVSKKLGVEITKSKSFILSKDVDIINMIKIGDKVEPNDFLFTITDGNVMKDDSKLNDKSLEILQNIKNKNPKAKIRGKISKIKIFYNCELEDMSESLKELAKISDKQFDNNTGKVNSSYSINGKSLNIDSLEIKIYIEEDIPVGVADKLVLGNQLKTTVSTVYSYPVKTADTGDNVEAMFSTSSVAARITGSNVLVATTTTLLDKLSDKVVNEYFN